MATTLVFSAALAGILIFAIVARGRAVRKPFSLRSLLTAITAIALLLGGTLAYRRGSMAQLRNVEKYKTQTLPIAEITQRDDGNFELFYRAKCRSIQSLIKHLEIGRGGYAVKNESVVIYSEEKPRVEAALATLLKHDKLPTGSVVIRGVVRQRDGKPLAGATLDVLGRYQFINCFQTRDDGTFTMALSDRDPMLPFGMGYYLRIRTAGETQRWNTGYISISKQNPEISVEIVVPL